LKHQIKEDQFARGFSLIEILITILLMSIILIGLYNLFDTNVKIYNAQQQVSTMDVRARTAMEQMVTAIRTAGSNNLYAIYLVDNPFIAVAKTDQIRVVEDLPHDNFDAACNATPDGDTFDRCDTNTDTFFNADDEDENADGYINDSLEDVTFHVTSAGLVRTEFLDDSYCPTSDDAACIGCPADCPLPTDEVLDTNVDSLTFEYFTNTNQPIVTPVEGNNLFNIKLVRVTLDARTQSLDRITKQPHTIRLRSDVFLRN
jgi:prepilin-type N-terminal cleavage/methylation domain-containing protein